MAKESKTLKKKLKKLVKKWGKQNANKPCWPEIRRYLKALKKHKKDPVKNPRPALLRGWWGAE